MTHLMLNVNKRKKQKIFSTKVTSFPRFLVHHTIRILLYWALLGTIPSGIAANGIFAPYPGCPLAYHSHSITQHLDNQLHREYSSTTGVVISANKIYSTESSSRLHFEDTVSLSRGGIQGYGDRISYDRRAGLMEMENAYFTYQGLRFWSNNVVLKENQDMLYKGVTFSRCGGAFDDLDWQVKADEVFYDKANNSLTLYHSRLDFYRLPVFYFPRMNIPLSRRSGLLFPKAGRYILSAYNLSSYFYSQPVFLNLGANKDMTHTFSWLQDRSILLSNQFRYLSSAVDLEIDADWMEKDSVLAQVNKRTDSRVTDYRRLILFSQAKLSSNWHLHTQWMDLSVRSFHQLFPQVILEKAYSGAFNQQVKLQGNYGKHQYHAEISQNISLKNETEDNYLQLPKLSYDYHTDLLNNQSLSVGLLASRLLSPAHRNLRNYQYIQARPIWKWDNHEGFYRTYTEFGGYQNHYQIDNFNHRNQHDSGKQQSYQTAYAKLGGQLYFNNTQAWYPSSIGSQLSPMLYYIYSPYKDPESIPFSGYSAKKIDSFRGLLDIRRYTRSDFIGESNRVVSGLSQTVFSSKWYLRATLGKNTDVVRPTTIALLPALDPAFSYWFGELAYRYGFLRFDLNTQWEKLGDGSPKRIFSQIYYENAQEDVFRLNYSQHIAQASVRGLDDEAQEYIGFGVSDRWGAWRLTYQTDYRLSDDHINSYLVGLVYDSCCWQFGTTMDGKSADANPKQLDHTINLSFTFKGLVSVGSVRSGEKIYRAVTAER